MPPETETRIAPRVLPRGARLADLAATAFVAAAAWIGIVGGGRYLVSGLVLPLNSPLVLLYIAASLLIVRHVIWTRPTAWSRLQVLYAAVLAREDMAAALRAFIATRPAVFIVGFFAVVTIGISNKSGFTLSPSPLANLPARYDAGWYGDIARGGYTWDHTFARQRNIAFFPAMPLLMRPLGTLFGMRDGTVTRERRMLRALWAGVVISLAAFLWGLHYLIRFGRELIGGERAANAALLLAAYPFAVFFNAPYTESLFLLSAVAACYHFRRGEWMSSSCWGLVAGLTRPNGCFVSVPLGILTLQHVHARIRSGEPWDTAATRLAGLRLLTAAMPGIGMLAFTAYLYGLTGVWFAWARSHEAWGRAFQGFAPFATAYGWLRDEPFLEVVANIPYNSLNALGVLFGLALTYPVFRRLGFAWGVFILVNLVPPLFAGGVLSMGRVSSTLFPLFLALATLLPTRTVPAWVAGFGIGQGLCATLFFTWRELF